MIESCYENTNKIHQKFYILKYEIFMIIICSLHTHTPKLRTDNTNEMIKQLF